MGCRWVLAGTVIGGMLFLCPIESAAEHLPKGNFETITVQKNEPLHSIRAQYPKFHGGKIYIDDAHRVNREIERFVQKIIADALQDGFSGNDFLAPSSYEKTDSKTKQRDEIKFEVLRADGHYVSIKFERYHYEEGGTHGLTIIFTFNYDISRRKFMRLGDLFWPRTPYLRGLSRACIEDLMQQLGPAEDVKIREGAAPQEKNFSVFGLSNKSLIVYFQTYQVAGYKAGLPKVRIPFNRIKGLKRELLRL